MKEKEENEVKTGIHYIRLQSDDGEAKVVIENYAEKIRWFIENQKKYTEMHLDELCLLTGRLDKKIFTIEL